MNRMAVQMRLAAANAPIEPLIAAASDLRFVLDDIAAAFAQAGGARPRIVYGSSGNLMRQIAQGAPFALFLSADEDFALRLVRAGLTTDDGALYAVGRLALIARKGAPLSIDDQLNGVAAALKANRIRRFAIANPDHAPYGQRARDVLQHASLWQAMQKHLVLGENVAQAAQFAISGAADAGLVGSALVKAPHIAPKVDSAIVPSGWHQALRQRMVLLKRAPKEQQSSALAFYEFLQGARARKLLQRAGFEPAPS